MFMKRNLKDVIKRPAHFLYQAALTALIASVDVSLSFTADFIAGRFMFFWRQRKELFRIGRERKLAQYISIIDSTGFRTFVKGRKEVKEKEWTFNSELP